MKTSRLIIALCLLPVVCTQTFATSLAEDTFDTDANGWTVVATVQGSNGFANPLTWHGNWAVNTVSGGGNPGGYISIRQPSTAS